MRVAKKTIAALTYVVLLAMTGCHTPAMRPTKCVCTPNGPCGGFFPTCWRQWPAECAMCPPMTEANVVSPAEAVGPESETVLPPPPQLRELPGEMPASETGEPDTSRNEPRHKSRAISADVRALDRSGLQVKSPRAAPPDRSVKTIASHPGEPVVFRRTTVELLQPPDSDSGEILLTPPSYPKSK